MPSKTKLKNAAIAAKSAALPSIPKELIDQFVTGPMSGEAVNAASMAFKKALIERALGAELGHHLGYSSSRCSFPSTSAASAASTTRSFRGGVAPCLGPRDPVLRVPAGGAPGDRHDG